jgi:hypothetical protein
MEMLRSAKQSWWQEVAQAAAKWERAISCFIKVRLMHERRPRRRWGQRVSGPMQDSLESPQDLRQHWRS